MLKTMKKPFLHALAAVTYIVVIVSIMSSTSSMEPSGKSVFIVPIVMLSLLVLSVAFMGFVFFYEPFRLYMENQKKEAVSFFLKTIGFFAGFLIIFSLILLFLQF